MRRVGAAGALDCDNYRIRTLGGAVEKMLKEFKDFLTRGNIVDLAVAFVLGVAFGAVVTSFVENILNPIIGAIFGQPSFDSLTIDLWGDAVLFYGTFLTALLSFVLVAAAVFFFVVRPYNALKARQASGEEEPPAAPPEDIQLLREIRDALNR
jgi:large conductance mechanosensitive channel